MHVRMWALTEQFSNRVTAGTSPESPPEKHAGPRYFLRTSFLSGYRVYLKFSE